MKKNRLVWPESIAWIIEVQAFSRSYDFNFISLLAHPLPTVSSTGNTQEEWERQIASWRDGTWGRGWGRSRILRQQESLVLHLSLNTLCGRQTTEYKPERQREAAPADLLKLRWIGTQGVHMTRFPSWVISLRLGVSLAYSSNNIVH